VKVLVTFGTRPEAIKMAPVVLRLSELAQAGHDVELTTCVTAQHREMLDRTLSIFGIRPDIDLDLMLPGQSLACFATRALEHLDRVIEDVAPQALLVQGDTSTAMAGALAAFYRRVPVGHVEAGLRTGNRYCPFPEEVNRRIISTLATWHFAPTDRAAEALRREGVDGADIHVTGNTSIDALLHVVASAPPWETDSLGPDGRLLLVTAHRRENFGEPLRRICRAVKELARRHPAVSFLFPVHPNPRVRPTVYEALGGVANVVLSEPLRYDEFVGAMKACYLILTDSGGIQEEAAALDKPVLVLRENTERPEAVAAGTARVVGTRADAIVAEVERLLASPDEYLEMAGATNPFGDGSAARRIVDILLAPGPPEDGPAPGAGERG